MKRYGYLIQRPLCGYPYQWLQVLLPVLPLCVHVTVTEVGYIFYAGRSIAGVSCRRRWPPPTTLALTTLVAQCEHSGR